MLNKLVAGFFVWQAAAMASGFDDPESKWVILGLPCVAALAMVLLRESS